jgi:hypothetical protein
MQLWRQIASGYLVLCLAFAGLVGISPDLHRLVEHGGDGPTHAHQGVATATHRPPVHSRDHSHPHPHEPDRAENKELEARKGPSGFFVSKHRSFSLPFARLWHGFVHFLEHSASVPDGSQDTDSSDNTPGHDHHSLAQLLAAGLLEQNVDAPVLAFDFVLYWSSLPTPEAVILGRRFDAQTAGRAPPSRWS